MQIVVGRWRGIAWLGAVNVLFLRHLSSLHHDAVTVTATQEPQTPSTNPSIKAHFAI